MYTSNRDTYRQTFFDAWQKHQKKLILQPIEAQLVEIIKLHPNYHRFLESPSNYQQQDFALEENPFFHMSLHLAVLEQLQSARPFGIKEIHQQLLVKYSNAHDVAHLMMDCLATTLWHASQTGSPPSEEYYLASLKEKVTT